MSAPNPGTIRFKEIAASPAAPPSGYAILYIKTDNVVYLKDSGGIEIPLGTASGITLLTGDVTAIGPGTSPATVVSVGGSSAANVHSAELAANAATSSNTVSTIVKRDASGNFSAGTITANLTGNASGSAASFTGSLSGDVTGTQSATAIASTVVTGKLLTGFISAPGTVSAADSILSAIDKLDGNINASVGTAITGLTGDISATGPGNVAATVNSVGTSSAANIHSAELAANAATSSNTVSTIVKRDGSGNFSAGIITASLTGNVTGNVSGSSASFTGSLVGDVTGTQGATVVSFVGTSSAANVHSAELAANAATDLNTASTIVKRDGAGSISITQVNGVAPEAHASRHLPSGADPLTTAAPPSNLDATTSNAVGTANSLARSDHSHAISTATVSTQTPDQSNAAGTSASLARADHIHNIPSGVPANIGTTNFQGAAASFALSDHVHNHANQTNPSLHALATSGAHGFMSSTDKAKIDAELPASLGTSNQVLGVNNAGTAGEYKSIVPTTNQVGVAFAAGSITLSTPQDIHSGATPTFAGENLTDRLELTEQSAPSTPASTKLRIYTEASNGMTRIRAIDSTGYVSTVLRDSFFMVKNTTGSTIAKGKAVYANGSSPSDGVLTIALAKADSSTTVPVLGLTVDSIPNNGFGRVLSLGIITGIDTSAFSAGQRVYLSATSAGDLTGTKPSSPNIWQHVGVVIISNASTGTIEVRPLSTHGEESGTNTAWSTNIVSLTDAANIATDASLGNTFTVTLGGNRNMSAPTNPLRDGQKITYRITQDATGSRTLTWDSIFNFGSLVPTLTLTTTANKTDYIGCIYNATSVKWDVVAVSKGF